MGKIKKIWNENRVLFVLAVIIIICLIIFVGVGLTYFYGSSKNVYGNRLDQIKDVPLDSKFLDNIKNTMNSKENVQNTTVNVKGKIVYISLEFNNGTTMDDAKKTAEEVISLFSEKELGLYDLQFTISNSAFTLMGAKNSNGSGQIIWNNYTVADKKASE